MITSEFLEYLKQHNLPQLLAEWMSQCFENKVENPKQYILGMLSLDKEDFALSNVVTLKQLKQKIGFMHCWLEEMAKQVDFLKIQENKTHKQLATLTTSDVVLNPESSSLIIPENLVMDISDAAQNNDVHMENDSLKNNEDDLKVMKNHDEPKRVLKPMITRNKGKLLAVYTFLNLMNYYLIIPT